MPVNILLFLLCGSRKRLTITRIIKAGLFQNKDLERNYRLKCTVLHNEQSQVEQKALVM